MKYTKDNKIYSAVTNVVLNGMQIFNPSHEQILEAGYSVYEEPQKTEDEKLQEAKENKVEEITDYDNSEAVNSFTYGGQSMWLSKADRVGLMNSTTILKNAGEENTTLWFGELSVTLPCDSVIAMLSALEKYALECYNVTASHKAAVNAMTTIEEVEAFDITEGYPDKLAF